MKSRSERKGGTVQHQFDISAFDSHPAFRIQRGRLRDRDACSAPRRNRNVWPLPSIAGTQPQMQPIGDGVAFAYESCDLGTFPAFVPILAVSDAVVEYAGKAHDTHSIVIDHGDGHRSAYYGLAHMFVMATTQHATPQRVRAGDVLGYQPSASKHVLRFSILQRDAAGHFHPLDAEQVMQSWPVLPLADDRTTPPTIQSLAA
jgi:hypothetical protein